jgi:hypothetical protein
VNGTKYVSQTVPKPPPFSIYKEETIFSKIPFLLILSPLFLFTQVAPKTVTLKVVSSKDPFKTVTKHRAAFKIWERML